MNPSLCGVIFDGNDAAELGSLSDSDFKRVDEVCGMLAAALDADVRLTAGHDLGSVWFETRAA